MRQIIIPVILLFAVACNNSSQTTERTDGFSDVPKTKEDSLYKEVMDGHDAAMAKIGKVKGYIQQVQKSIDSISKLPDSAGKGQVLGQYKNLQDELSYAENAMDMWMTEFNPDSNNTDATKRSMYLQSEKDKVNKVGMAINESLQKADALLGGKH